MHNKENEIVGCLPCSALFNVGSSIKMRDVNAHGGSLEDNSLIELSIVFGFHVHLSSHLSYPPPFLFPFLQDGSGMIICISLLSSDFSFLVLKANNPLFSFVLWSFRFLFLYGTLDRGRLVRIVFRVSVLFSSKISLTSLLLSLGFLISFSQLVATISACFSRERSKGVCASRAILVSNALLPVTRESTNVSSFLRFYCVKNLVYKLLFRMVCVTINLRMIYSRLDRVSFSM